MARHRPRPQATRILGIGITVPPEVTPLVTERRWQAQVLQLASAFGWKGYHTWNSQHSAAGFPDLVLVRRPRVVFAELKTNRGLVSDAQQAWLDELAACGLEAYVWRPGDLEHVVRTLR
jgi:hypothetical protein